MNLSEIKNAVDSGKQVFWKNISYEVIKTRTDYMIRCKFNDHCIGLTKSDGITINGKESDFFLAKPEPENLPYCHVDHPRHSEWLMRVAQLEAEGCTTSDAQSITDIEMATT